MAVLKAENLIKIYGKGENQVKALNGVSLSVEKGEFVAVVGTSGSGKSTLLHMLGGLDRPDSGKVYIEDKDIFALKEEELTIFRRRKIGFVFQSYNLVPVLSVYENVVLPVELDGKKADRAFVNDILDTLGIREKAANLPGQLSGGQQQRAAIARALIFRPAILLADEPTGNLDRKNSEEIMDLIRLSSRNLKQTVLLVTHDERIALRAERIVTIEDGRIVSDRKQG